MSGSGSPIERLYREHGHVVARCGRRLLGSAADAQELVQDVFMSLLTDDARVATIERPAAWLHAVATRRALNRLRDRSTRARIVADELVPVLDAAPSAVPGRATEVAELLVRLPDDELAAVVHFYLDEMTHDEIAVQLACSRRHVGNLLTRARAALRAAAALTDEETTP